MRYGILGGGFGLYGYLPAIAGLNPERIVTLERYRATLRKRPELAGLEACVSFVAEERMVIDHSDVLVIAQRPVDQERWVNQLPKSWRGTLILEKPLASNPTQAETLEQLLAAANRRYVMGFSILETNWAQALLKTFETHRPTHINFNWRFLAHHYRHNLDNWKRQVSEGGGALRFYSIHLIALLSRLGDWTPVFCSPPAYANEDPSLDFAVQSSNCQAIIHCDSQWESEPTFELTVRQGGWQLINYRLANPFSTGNAIDDQSSSADARIFPLQQILRRAVESTAVMDRINHAHLRLWTALEQLRFSSGRRD